MSSPPLLARQAGGVESLRPLEEVLSSGDQAASDREQLEHPKR
jgi:hypothetical protein